MAKGRAVAIVLDDVEKRELTALTRKHGAPQAVAERARIVWRRLAVSRTMRSPRSLGSARTRSAPGATALPTTVWTVSTTSRGPAHRGDWRRRNREHDPQNVGDATKGGTHWSLRSMAKEIGHAAFDGASHLARLRSATAPRRDFQVVHRSAVRRESARYRRALLVATRSAIVLCVDEKSQVQALDRTQPRCRCGPDRPSGAPTIISGTERHRCSRHSM